jgi:hypothetical protein
LLLIRLKTKEAKIKYKNIKLKYNKERLHKLLGPEIVRGPVLGCSPKLQETCISGTSARLSTAV